MMNTAPLVAALDWQVASAVVQAGAAVAIVILTGVLVSTNRGTLREMRKEREHERHRRSVRAAQELTRAATELMVKWRSAEDDPMAEIGGLRTTSADERPQGSEAKREDAFREWRSAYLTERANILPPALSEDLGRFHAAVSTALSDWTPSGSWTTTATDPTHRGTGPTTAGTAWAGASVAS